MRANARAIGADAPLGRAQRRCLPLLDVRQPGATDIIGDRALRLEPMQVAALGRAVLDGLASAGVVGIVKHMPGHGRALVDSHKELPVVTASAEELEVDLEPFERLALGADGDDGARRLRGVGSRSIRRACRRSSSATSSVAGSGSTAS